MTDEKLREIARSAARRYLMDVRANGPVDMAEFVDSALLTLQHAGGEDYYATEDDCCRIDTLAGALVKKAMAKASVL
jgi:hypothetical protein